MALVLSEMDMQFLHAFNRAAEGGGVTGVSGNRCAYAHIWESSRHYEETTDAERQTYLIGLSE